MATTSGTSRGRKTTGESTAQKAKPIVYERDDDDDDDDDGREYSDGTKDLQVVSDGFVNFADSLAKAVKDGVGTYRDKHHASARKKKDGAVRDLVENVSEGLSEALETAADAPRELSKKVTLKRLTRLVTPQPFNIFLRR